MSYFRKFFQACTGPSAFVGLYRSGGWQAFGHMLLTAVLAGVLFGVLFAGTQSGELERAGARFDAEFGRVMVYEHVCLPQKRPEVGRTLLVNSFSAVTYLPPAGDAETPLPELMPEGVLRGVVWTPERAWLWALTGGGKEPDQDEMLVLAFPMTDRNYQFTRGSFTAMVMEACRAEAAVELGKEVESFAVTDWNAGMWLGIGTGFYWAVWVAFLACFFCGIFVLTTGILGGSRNLNRKQMWVVLLYAGLPVMLVGTVVQALGLGIDYTTIYIFGLVGYLLFILRKIELALRPPPPVAGEDDSDMDF